MINPQTTDNSIDILEDDIAEYNNGLVLRELLMDQTKNKLHGHSINDSTEFIIWGTSDYSDLGEGYGEHDEIRPELITGEGRGNIIMPRVLKEKHQQIARAKDKAEVFTPSWVCNAQNNLVDDAWFGKTEVFNHEFVDENGVHTWTPTDHVDFTSTDKTWQEYVKDNRMEITCGEAPYLVSRYDTTTGKFIPVKNRIGLLDRKLRVVNENTDSKEDWLKYAQLAYKSVYGYEWQGDNLLLAREALFKTFIDYYKEKFGKDAAIHPNSLQCIANVISWNLWQMDGIKYVIPGSCHDIPNPDGGSLFSDSPDMVPCPGCKNGDYTQHSGITPLIRDWTLYENYHADKNGVIGRERSDVKFYELWKK